MVEVRVTVSKRMDNLLQRIINSGLFVSKAELVRFAIIAYLNELGFLGGKTATTMESTSPDEVGYNTIRKEVRRN